MAAPTGEYERATDYTAQFRGLVDCLDEVYGNKAGIYVPVKMDRPGVREAVNDLYRTGFLSSLDALNECMSGDFNYGYETSLGKVCVPAVIEADVAEKPTKTPLNKTSVCALAKGQRLTGVGVFTRCDRQDTALGVRIQHSRKLFPHGHVVYTQQLYTVISPQGPPALVQTGRCEVVYDPPSYDECDELPEALVFLDDTWDMKPTADSAGWMVNLIVQDLGLPLR